MLFRFVILKKKFDVLEQAELLRFFSEGFVAEERVEGAVDQ
jgi:hypothetical protein